MPDHRPSGIVVCAMLGISDHPPMRELCMRRDAYRLPNFKQTRSHNVQSVGSMAPVDRHIEREQSRNIRVVVLPPPQRAIVRAADAHWNGGDDFDRVDAVGMVLAELQYQHAQRAVERHEAELERDAAAIGDNQQRFDEAYAHWSLMNAELWRCNANRLPAIAAAVVLEIISGHGWSEAERRKAIGVTHKGSSRNWSMPYLWALERWMGIYRAGLDSVRGAP